MTVELCYINPIDFCHGETEFNGFYFINSLEKLTALKENPKMLSFGQIKDVTEVFLISQNHFKYVFKGLQIKMFHFRNTVLYT